MHFFFALLALATAVVAQTTSGCAAHYIVETCLGTQMSLLSSCDIDDWECKCRAYSQIVACYDNCPDDIRLYTAAGQKVIFCGYASEFPSAEATASVGLSIQVSGFVTSSIAATASIPASVSATTTAATNASTTASAILASTATDVTNGAVLTASTAATLATTGTAATATETAAATALAIHTGGLLAVVAAAAALLL